MGHISRDAEAGEGTLTHINTHIKRGIFYLSLSVSVIPYFQKVKASHATIATPVQHNAIQSNSPARNTTFVKLFAKAVREALIQLCCDFGARSLCWSCIGLHSIAQLPNRPMFSLNLYSHADNSMNSRLIDYLMDRKLSLINNFDNRWFVFFLMQKKQKFIGLSVSKWVIAGFLCLLQSLIICK